MVDFPKDGHISLPGHINKVFSNKANNRATYFGPQGGPINEVLLYPK